MHYVIGDIHGQIHTMKRLLEKLQLKSEDKVYFVGDWFDRAYTEKDMAETVEWMLEHLKEDSQFRSVLGNHDRSELYYIDEYLQNCDKQEKNPEWQMLRWSEESFEGSKEAQYIRSCYPELKRLIESMPLYETFTVNGQEYLVTHSWLWDNSGKALGKEGFDIHDLNVDNSIWDRDFSLHNYVHIKDMPIVIHGHTPTLGKNDIMTDGCIPLAKIQKVSEKNINVDCCAFYSPLRGGNLAAYCCEDSSEIYAYEDEVFYELVEHFFEKKPIEEFDITKEEWYFLVLFYDWFFIFDPKEDEICFHDERVKWVYEIFRERFEDCNERDWEFEIYDYVRRVKARLHAIVPQYWLICREG